MKATVLLCCDTSNIHFLPSFYNSLSIQIEPIHEVVVCLNKDEEQVLEAVRQQFTDAPFEVKYSFNNYKYDYDKYTDAMQQITGDYVLFADAKHPFTEKKVEQFSRYFDDDPYIRYAFTNLEVIDGTNQIILLDYFGITGFYERWDYFKSLVQVMAKQIGFVNDFQIGITTKTVQRFLKFIEENQFDFDIRFEDFLSTFIGVRYYDTIKEIPYVLNQYRLTVDEIEQVQTQKRKLNYTPQEQVHWLENLQLLVNVIDKEHKVLGYISKALAFHSERAERHANNNFSIGYAAKNYATRTYSKYSYEAMNLFQKDRGQ